MNRGSSSQIQYSEEQEAIFRSGPGFSVAVANAGTGKCVHPSMRVVLQVGSRRVETTMDQSWQKWATRPIRVEDGWYAGTSEPLHCLSWDGSAWVWAQISALFRMWVDEELVTIVLHTGERLWGTRSHRCFDGSNYVPLGKMTRGMQVAKPDTGTGLWGGSRTGNRPWWHWSSKGRDDPAQAVLTDILTRPIAYGTVVSVERNRYKGWVYDFSVLPHRNYVVAGMLTHNTECCGEYFVRHFLSEQQRAKDKTPEELLRLFRVVTFTRKAAANLDQRIWRKLAHHGVVLPTLPSGQKLRICRTLDSYLASWHRNPVVFRAWSAMFPDRVEALSRLVGRTLTEDEARRWVWHVPDDFSEWLWLGLVGHKNGFPWRGTEDVVREIREAMARSGPNQQLHRDMLGALVQTIRGVHEPYREKEKRLHDPRLSVSERATLSGELALWQGVVARAEAAAGIYDLARTRGYAEDAPWVLGQRGISKQVAMTDWPTLRSIHDVMQEYSALKRDLGLLDYQDTLRQLSAVFRGEGSRWIMDRAREYPRYGVRAKYVIWDEVQDNNPDQYWVLRMLCGTASSGYHCLVIGDPKQSIYHFRGASPTQFNAIIEKQLKDAPEQLFTLSRSFRSDRAIVRLGNEIARQLPERPGMVVDSSTRSVGEGFVEASPRLRDVEAATAWVQQRIGELRRDYGPDKTVMLLVRNHVQAHPLARWASNQVRVEAMTIHASKGLEADFVFVLGLVAGAFPDVRCSWDEESNAMYVACTRARHGLCLVAHLVEREEKGSGEVALVERGLSPFVGKVSNLRELFLGAGWKESDLVLGQKTHQERIATLLSQTDARVTRLMAEPLAKRPVSGVVDVDAVDEVKPLSVVVPTKGGGAPNPSAGSESDSGSEMREDEQGQLLQRLAYQFLRSRSCRGVSKVDLLAGEKMGWVAKVGSGYGFTPKFHSLCQEAARPKPKLFSEA